MQTGKEHLMAQQQVMAAKNMYNGKIDGIWGPKSIAAMQKWERSGKFAPAIPSNGFPLDDRKPLPPGVSRLSDGSLTCIELESKKAKQESASTPAPAPASAPEKIVIPAASGDDAKPVQANAANNHGNNQQQKK